MQKSKAEEYFRHGMKMMHVDRREDALTCFTKAIEHNPEHVEAYRFRGEVLHMLGREEEANIDLKKARELKKINTTKKASRKVEKYDYKDSHSIYDDLQSYGDEEPIDFDDHGYDYVFSDDTLESGQLLAGMAAEPAVQQPDYPAILEYLDGRREEALVVRLFGPAQDEITLARKEDGGEKVIYLEQLSCIRLSRLPTGLARNRDASCQVEIIETVDGNIYHESIPAEQTLKNVLCGFSTKQDSRFKYTMIPRINIRKRSQRRQLGQILVEKKLIVGDVLRQALTEYDELRKVKFGKIIAQHAKILYSAVEFEIQKAYQANQQGRKVGEILMDAGLVTEAQIIGALQYQERLRNMKLGQFMIEKGIIQERELYLALAEKFRIPFVELRQQKVTRAIISLIPAELIQKLHVLPLGVQGDTLVVATLQPEPGPICEILCKYSKKEIEFVLVQPSHLKNVIRMLFQKKG